MHRTQMRINIFQAARVIYLPIRVDGIGKCGPIFGDIKRRQVVIAVETLEQIAQTPGLDFPSHTGEGQMTVHERDSRRVYERGTSGTLRANYPGFTRFLRVPGYFISVVKIDPERIDRCADGGQIAVLNYVCPPQVFGIVQNVLWVLSAENGIQK